MQCIIKLHIQAKAEAQYAFTARYSSGMYTATTIMILPAVAAVVLVLAVVVL